MTKKSKEQVVEQITSVHLVKAISHSVTTDAKFCMIVFDAVDEVVDGNIKSTKKFGITIDAKAAAWWRSVAIELEAHAIRRGVFGINRRLKWGIGSSVAMPGMTAIVVSPDMIACTIDNYTVVAPDVQICKLANAILRDVEPKLSPMELIESKKLPKQSGPIIRP